MVENERFQGLDGQRYPVLEFDGQNQTEARVGWPKMDFFLFLMIEFISFGCVLISGEHVPKLDENG